MPTLTKHSRSKKHLWLQPKTKQEKIRFYANLLNKMAKDKNMMVTK